MTNGDSSGSHRFEVGSFSVHNLLPNALYRDVLCPHDPSGKGHRVDREVSLRILSQYQPPVGGIGVIEHLEVNVVPLAVRLTHQLYTTLMKFFFPDKAPAQQSETEKSPALAALSRSGEITDHRVSTLSLASSTTIESSSSAVAPATTKGKKDRGRQRDEIEIMQERASHNNSFIYIKIPAVPLCVSYKGEKNIEDVEDVHLVFPNVEYHNRTWTWHDLLMEIKKESKNVLLSQAIKQKLGISRPDSAAEGGKDTTAEKAGGDKSKLLFGMRTSSVNPLKAGKKLFGKLSKKMHSEKSSHAGTAPVASSNDADEGLGALGSPIEPLDLRATFDMLSRCTDDDSTDLQTTEN